MYMYEREKEREGEILWNNQKRVHLENSWLDTRICCFETPAFKILLVQLYSFVLRTEKKYRGKMFASRDV